MADDPSTRQDQTYSLAARRFHWWTAAFVTVQVPVGLYMAYRGNVLGIFDGTTNFLYSSHKTVGLVIFALVVWRLLYRLVRGAPHPEPTITPWQRTASKLNHWALYSLLLVVPILAAAWWPRWRTPLVASLGARAYWAAGVRHIVYVGGLLPQDRPLSPHLKSRLEVSEVLGGRGVAVTSLRCGIIIGEGSASFSIWMRLADSSSP